MHCLLSFEVWIILSTELLKIIQRLFCYIMHKQEHNISVLADTLFPGLILQELLCGIFLV